MLKPAQAMRAADARALYLLPPKALQLSSTGEALVGATADAQAMRFPVRLLLRVVCNERVHWSGAALALCQSRGIPVCWLDDQGQALGHLYPARARCARLAEVLEALACMPGDWPQRYEHWLRQQRLRVLLRWQDARRCSGRPVDEAELQRAKSAWVYRNELASHLPPELQGMASALVAQLLSADGVQPQYWCGSGQALSLADDLTRLLWAEMNLQGGTLADALHAGRAAAAVFEHGSRGWADQLQAHLASLKALACRCLQS